MEDNVQVISSEDSKLEETGKSEILINYEKMFKSGEDADVYICVQGQEISAHKNILKGDFKEKGENRVEIGEFRYEVISAMLRYIYSANISGISHIAAELMGAAVKYQLPHLKAVCEKKCLCVMNDVNVANFFRVAVLHDAEILKKAAVKHIYENYTAVIKTNGWQDFQKQIKNTTSLERSPPTKRSRVSTSNEQH